MKTVVCDKCIGYGILKSQYPTAGSPSYSTCYRCNGTGSIVDVGYKTGVFITTFRKRDGDE